MPLLWHVLNLGLRALGEGSGYNVILTLTHSSECSCEVSLGIHLHASCDFKLLYCAEDEWSKRGRQQTILDLR